MACWGFRLALLGVLAWPGVNPGGLRPGGAGARRVRAAWGLRPGRPCPAVGRGPEPRVRGAPFGAGLTPGQAKPGWSAGAGWRAGGVQVVSCVR